MRRCRGREGESRCCGARFVRGAGAGSFHSLGSEFQKGRIPWLLLWDNAVVDKEKENYGISLLGLQRAGSEQQMG